MHRHTGRSVAYLRGCIGSAEACIALHRPLAVSTFLSAEARERQRRVRPEQKEQNGSLSLFSLHTLSFQGERQSAQPLRGCPVPLSKTQACVAVKVRVLRSAFVNACGYAERRAHRAPPPRARARRAHAPVAPPTRVASMWGHASPCLRRSGRSLG